MQRNGRSALSLPSLVAVLIVLSTPAWACRGPQLEQTQLLRWIPPVAQDSPVQAEVEILSATGEVATAQVLEAVRGVDPGQIVRISAVASSCGGGIGLGDVGRVAYIAGRIDPASNLFSGRHPRGKVPEGAW
jgi:hypothetical protein